MMTIKQVLREMQEYTDTGKFLSALLMTRKWAKALEQYAQFEPPQEVIDAWPENTPWCVRWKAEPEWVYLHDHYELEDISMTAYDPRTLRHRTCYYKEGNQ